MCKDDGIGSACSPYCAELVSGTPEHGLNEDGERAAEVITLLNGANEKDYIVRPAQRLQMISALCDPVLNLRPMTSLILLLSFSLSMVDLLLRCLNSLLPSTAYR